MYFPGDLGDGRLNLYFLEHAYRFFTFLETSFWSAPFMYPEPNIIAYSDNLLGTAPFYSLFRLIGFDMFASYQLWFLMISALNYTTAFLLLKKITGNSYASVIGALIFAFSLSLQSQLTHAQTFPRFAIPIAFLMAVRFSEELKPKFLVLAVLFWVYQMYCAIYLGLMLLIPLSIFLGLVFIANFHKIKGKIVNEKLWVLWISIGLIASAILLLPLILPYLGNRIPASSYHYDYIFSTIPSIRSWFFTQDGSLFWDKLSGTATHYEAWWDHQIFPGGVAFMAFVITAFYLSWRLFIIKLKNIKTLDLLIVTGIVTFLLFLRTGDFAAYKIIYNLPGYTALRSITRIVNIQLIFFAISSALVISWIIRQESKYALVIFLLFIALVISDNYFFSSKSYRTSRAVAFERLEELDDIFSKIPAGSIVSYEPSETSSNTAYYHLDAMLLGQKYGLKVINGYTATSPAGYGPYWHSPDENSRDQWLWVNNLNFDFIYVVNSSRQLQVVSYNEFEQSSVFAEKSEILEQIIQSIRDDKKWMQIIEDKALKKGIPLDSMLLMDARYMLGKVQN
jgi:hypothetical protein